LSTPPAPDPTDEELTAFAAAMLAQLGEHFREPEVLAEALSEQRELWETLYRVSLGLEELEELPPRNSRPR
jgi:hypothetical protein